MKWPSLLVVACGLLLGCSGGEASRDPLSPDLVSDFTSPALEGMAVRDHPFGVEIVTAPTGARGTTVSCSNAVGAALMSCLSPGIVLTAVGDVPIRSATQFRDRVNSSPGGYRFRFIPPGTATVDGAVGRFADPALTEMTVRDHPEGAVIVTPPFHDMTDIPGISRNMGYQPGLVIRKVNGTRVRDAVHLRDAMNQAYDTNANVMLEM